MLEPLTYFVGSLDSTVVLISIKGTSPISPVSRSNVAPMLEGCCKGVALIHVRSMFGVRPNIYRTYSEHIADKDRRSIEARQELRFGKSRGRHEKRGMTIREASEGNMRSNGEVYESSITGVVRNVSVSNKNNYIFLWYFAYLIVPLQNNDKRIKL